MAAVRSGVARCYDKAANWPDFLGGLREYDELVDLRHDILFVLARLPARNGEIPVTSVAANRVNRAREFFSKEKLAPELSWIDDLSPLHLRLFAVELSAVLAPPSPDAEQFDSLLEAWQATAELDASPELQEHIERNRRGKFGSADEWLASKSIE